MKRLSLALSLMFALAAQAAEPPTLAGAEAVVRAQYGADADSSQEAMTRLYVTDIARELVDPIRGAGAVNLGIDPRYGQDDWRGEDVKVSAAPGPNGEARVTVRFLNFGKPSEVDWRLVPAPDGRMGWKVADISAPPQNDWPAWDMRELLNLPPRK